MISRLYLIRHGSVDERWRGRIYGALEVPLSSAGEQESLLLAQRLASVPFSAVVSSGLGRTEFLARALRAGRDLPRVDDSDLREIERGAWAGLSLAEIEHREPGAWSDWLRSPTLRRPPGGESLADLARRVLPALDRWASLHPDGCVALVTHSWVARVSTCAALAIDESRASVLEVPTSSFVILDWPAQRGSTGALPAARPTLVAFATRDLPPEGRNWFQGPTTASSPR